MLMRNIKFAPPLNYYKEYTTATAPLTITAYLLKKDFHMARHFFVRRVCKYDLSVIDAFTIVEQVKNVSGNSEKF